MEPQEDPQESHQKIKPIIESLLFSSGEVMSAGDLLKILESTPPAGFENIELNKKDLEKILGEMEAEWKEKNCGIILAQVAQGYQFRTRPELAPWIHALGRPKPQRLSTPAIETLALIAYRQPITRAEIEEVRGVDSGGVLKNILDRKLIRVVGRKEEAGRSLLYATRQEFLEFFGLKDLSDLPPLSELEELIRAQNQEKLQSAEGGLQLADLITTPEDSLIVDERDREALDDLEQSLEQLKSVEASLLSHPLDTTPEEEPPPSNAA